MKNNRPAFTLIELLIAIVIIGVLGGVVFVNFISSQKNARDSRRLADMKQVQTAMDVYIVNNKYYPPTQTGAYRGSSNGWAALIARLRESALLDKEITDPKAANNYQFRLYKDGDGYSDCEGNGRYYVIGVTDMETVSAGQKHSDNPGWGCRTKNSPGDAAFSDAPWASWEWAAGKFEK